jgi:hypothetical protein
MLVGQTSSVPVRLLSTTALTNMTFTVVYPVERFSTNFTLTASSAQVLTQQWRLVAPGQIELSFTLPADSVLHGPTNVGELSFTAVSNQSSAFVPLLISDVADLTPDGGLVASAYGQPGRVVVVGPEPLLEAGWGGNRQALLTLYGKPGSSYAMEWRTNLMAGAWQFAWRAPMTNLFQDFGIEATRPRQFYRAYEFFADPPLLLLDGSSNLVLLLYGRAETNYVIQTTTNLVSGANWIPLTNFALTNSFRFLDTGRPTNRAQFFRTLRP